jgi:hypothetical protein
MVRRYRHRRVEDLRNSRSRCPTGPASRCNAWDQRAASWSRALSALSNLGARSVCVHADGLAPGKRPVTRDPRIFADRQFAESGLPVQRLLFRMPRAVIRSLSEGNRGFNFQARLIPAAAESCASDFPGRVPNRPSSFGWSHCALDAPDDALARGRIAGLRSHGRRLEDGISRP